MWWLPEMATVAVFALGWWPCCCYYMISCGACANGTARDEMQVEISGMTDDDCTGSANWNGTWIVAFVSDSGGSCTWQYILSAAQPTNHRVAVGLTPTCEASANSYVNLSVIKSGTDYHWLVSLNDLDASVNLNQYAWVGNICSIHGRISPMQHLFSPWEEPDNRELKNLMPYSDQSSFPKSR